MSEIPAEAIEAASEAAYRIYVQDVGQTLATRDLTNAITDAVLAAALPHLAAHDAEAARAARVLPSVEDVKAEARRLYPNDGDPGTEPEEVAADREVFVQGFMHALAQTADAPSREQVEREAAEKAWDEGFVSGFEECASGGQVDATEGNPYRADRLAAGGDRV